MTALYRPDMRPYEIFDITYDCSGYPVFLIYRSGQWLRRSAKHFTPNFYEDGMGGYTEMGDARRSKKSEAII